MAQNGLVVMAQVSSTHTLPETSFVIRLWLEARDLPADPVWRFEVRHVQTGQQIHCRALADVLAFVERRAGVPRPQLGASDDQQVEEVEP